MDVIFHIHGNPGYAQRRVAINRWKSQVRYWWHSDMWAISHVRRHGNVARDQCRRRITHVLHNILSYSYLITYTYLSSVLTPHQPQRSLRPVNQNLLSVPRCNSSFGQRRLSYCAPRIWNDIPLSVRQSLSLDSFKRNLKTHYFANNWPPDDCLQRLWFDILDTFRSTNCYKWMNEWMNEYETYSRIDSYHRHGRQNHRRLTLQSRWRSR